MGPVLGAQLNAAGTPLAPSSHMEVHVRIALVLMIGQGSAAQDRLATYAGMRARTARSRSGTGGTPASAGAPLWSRPPISWTCCATLEVSRLPPRSFVRSVCRFGEDLVLWRGSKINHLPLLMRVWPTQNFLWLSACQRTSRDIMCRNNQQCWKGHLRNVAFQMFLRMMTA